MILNANALYIPLKDESVQTVVKTLEVSKTYQGYFEGAGAAVILVRDVLEENGIDWRKY